MYVSSTRTRSSIHRLPRPIAISNLRTAIHRVHKISVPDKSYYAGQPSQPPAPGRGAASESTSVTQSKTASITTVAPPPPPPPPPVSEVESKTTRKHDGFSYTQGPSTRMQQRWATATGTEITRGGRLVGTVAGQQSEGTKRLAEMEAMPEG
jgi:hypothetical protein